MPVKLLFFNAQNNGNEVIRHQRLHRTHGYIPENPDLTDGSSRNFHVFTLLNLTPDTTLAKDSPNRPVMTS